VADRDSLKSYSTMNVKTPNSSQSLGSSKNNLCCFQIPSNSWYKFVLNVHVQILCHLGIFTFNSSSVADIRQTIHFVMLVSPRMMVSPGVV